VGHQTGDGPISLHDCPPFLSQTTWTPTRRTIQSLLDHFYMAEVPHQGAADGSVKVFWATPHGLTELRKHLKK